ncbi:MAG TPA: hypothetical protein VFE60_07785 [Roseiarcus sp.]|jgi:hypothetical protein|nr:hypothetical protein [Roseiarcus sp.]
MGGVAYARLIRALAGSRPASGSERSSSRRRRQAGEVLRLRIRVSRLRPAKPASVIAQVEASGASGTAFKGSMSIEPSPLLMPAVRAWLVNSFAR